MDKETRAKLQKYSERAERIASEVGIHLAGLLFLVWLNGVAFVNREQIFQNSKALWAIACCATPVLGADIAATYYAVRRGSRWSRSRQLRREQNELQDESPPDKQRLPLGKFILHQSEGSRQLLLGEKLELQFPLTTEPPETLRLEIEIDTQDTDRVILTFRRDYYSLRFNWGFIDGKNGNAFVQQEPHFGVDIRNTLAETGTGISFSADHQTLYIHLAPGEAQVLAEFEPNEQFVAFRAQQMHLLEPSAELVSENV